MGLRLIYKPSVYLVSVPRIDHDELDRFLSDIGSDDWMSDADTPADMLPEISGRLCYSSYKSPRPGGNRAYLNHILEAGHGSVLEHSVFGVIITGISRSCSHQLVRHRAGLSPSQLSQRFVDESDTAFVVPPAMVDMVRLVHDERDGGDTEARDAAYRWITSVDLSRSNYKRIVASLDMRDEYDPRDRTARRKAIREAARSVLPEATETRLYLTGNVRAWRNVLEQRGAAGADAEIRRLAVALYRVISPAAPALFADYEVVDGIITTQFRKV